MTDAEISTNPNTGELETESSAWGSYENPYKRDLFQKYQFNKDIDVLERHATGKDMTILHVHFEVETAKWNFFLERLMDKHQYSQLRSNGRTVNIPLIYDRTNPDKPIWSVDLEIEDHGSCNEEEHNLSLFIGTKLTTYLNSREM